MNNHSLIYETTKEQRKFFYDLMYENLEYVRWKSKEHFMEWGEHIWSNIGLEELMIKDSEGNLVCYLGMYIGEHLHFGRVVDVMVCTILTDSAEVLKFVAKVIKNFAKDNGCSGYVRSIHKGTNEIILKFKEV